jgi:hypothetical protein
MLKDMIKNKTAVQDELDIKNNYCYYKVNYDYNTLIPLDYNINAKKIDKLKLNSGFFSILTYGVNFNAIETYKNYRLRDEQEKYFQQMKSQMVSDRQRNWSEEGKAGRLLILFVSLILSSYVRHTWRSTTLHDDFSSSLELLDEMSSIRCIEHPDRAKLITPFVGAQLDVCKAFGFEVPKGCAPVYPSQKTASRKRGRPPKRAVEREAESSFC